MLKTLLYSYTFVLEKHYNYVYVSDMLYFS